MKKEKKNELIKAAIPAIMVLSGMWSATASVGGDARPTASDVAAFRNQESRQEQPAETAFMQGEDSEGEVILTSKYGCKAQCMASCNFACEGNCKSSCAVKCSNDCTGNCTKGCGGLCSNNCTTGCSGQCGSGCVGTCSGGHTLDVNRGTGSSGVLF